MDTYNLFWPPELKAPDDALPPAKAHRLVNKIVKLVRNLYAIEVHLVLAAVVMTLTSSVPIEERGQQWDLLMALLKRTREAQKNTDLN